MRRMGFLAVRMHDVVLSLAQKPLMSSGRLRCETRNKLKTNVMGSENRTTPMISLFLAFGDRFL